MREQLLAEIESQVEVNPHIPPVVGLDEYFSGNTDEACIAPNQVGYGRPALAELYVKFKGIEKRADVQAVLVGIHPDWAEAKDCPEVWPSAENVHIYTSAPKDVVA